MIILCLLLRMIKLWSTFKISDPNFYMEQLPSEMKGGLLSSPIRSILVWLGFTFLTSSHCQMRFGTKNIQYYIIFPENGEVGMM